MPVAENWRTTPHSLVSKVYNARQENAGPWQEKVSAMFTELLSKENLDTLPSLNETPNHELTDGQLVRFKGMVQDMYDPEIYMAEYETRNLSTGVRTVHCGRYRDVLHSSIKEEVLEESEHNVMKDRGVLYCVSIPGENPWVADVLTSRGDAQAGPSGTYHNPLKRGLEPAASNGNSEMESEEMETENGDAANHNGTTAEHVGGKRSKGEDGNPVAGLNGTAAGHTDLNLPIPNGKGKAVIVKLYDTPEGSVKLCDMLDLVGIVSLDPAMAVSEPEEMMGSSLPPPSLVPRLHVVQMKKMSHNNPLAGSLTLHQTEMESSRAQLLHILSQALLCDSLAAEYLLYNLVSKVYGRRDVQVLGKMCLNLFNISSQSNWSRRIYTILGLLMPGSHYLPLSRQQLEKTRFIPQKDFEANRLVSGILQLPSGTSLIIDETAMNDGQLSAQAVKNLTAIGNLISWQKVDYDFKYHTLEYETDIPVMVMSEGRSLLPSDFQVMVKTEDSPSNMLETCFRNISSLLNQDLLNRLRLYLTQCREQEYSLTEELQKEVQDDFVRMRQENQGQVTVDDLHAHLVLARLVAVSKGKSSLDEGDWNHVKQLERTRRSQRTAAPRAEPRAPNGLPLHISAN